LASVNRVTLLGNVGQDPEMRYLPSGEAVAKFSIATTETWKDKAGGKQERTDWHRVEFIGRTAEIVGEYVKKGRQVYVEGSVRYDKWTDKEGVEKLLTKIKGDKLTLLGSRDGAGGGGSGGGGDAAFDDNERSNERGGSTPRSTGQPMGSAAGAKKAKLDDFDDDIPF
jgi:single-strand DNA-binding protein